MDGWEMRGRSSGRETALDERHWMALSNTSNGNNRPEGVCVCVCVC